VRKLLIKTLWAAALSGLVAGAVGFTTQTAKANTSSLYACDYSTQNSYTGVWDFPGGPSRPGNKTNDHTYSSRPFNSIPWISSVTVYGQRWIYGQLDPYVGGAYGWVGKNYLTNTNCFTSTFQTSNYAISGSHQGDPFSSQPSEVSATYQGQTWVWGIDPYATSHAGWIGRKWLTLSSCNSSGCYYTINASNIREWRLPGGAGGP
jgi:hypothetical protein